MADGVVTSLARELIDQLTADLEPRRGRLGKVRRYLRGHHDLPYMPRGATTEYRLLAHKSITNWLPLISDTFVKALYVDGYRGTKSAQNAEAWRYWQANGMDARQSVSYRGALEYGASYDLVLPGKPAPLIRPLSPTRSLAWYEDDDDDYPQFGLLHSGSRMDGAKVYKLYDATSEYVFSTVKSDDGPGLVLEETNDHGLGVTPFIRFRDRLDGEACGIIEPLIKIQDRINEAVFQLLIALQYASFRQRWATGMVIPSDTNEFVIDPVTGEPRHDQDGNPLPNPNFGKPIEPYEAAVNRLWINDNPDAKFGDFDQTDVTGHLKAYDSSVKTLAAIAQTSPHVLTGDLNNLAAEALAALDNTKTAKAEEFATLFAEPREQELRLAALADGNKAAAEDTSAQVRWRDTEARSLAATVDALGKMVQMLGVPNEAAWERIPDVTDQDIERWRGMANSGDGLAAIAAALGRQATPAVPPAPGQPAVSPAPAPAA
jgi:hypothetical protein